MVEPNFPTSQRELLRSARGAVTQAAFAKQLGIDRSCLSRYESETLGAPTVVLNFCLRAIAERERPGSTDTSDVHQALAHARRTVETLERAAGPTPSSRSSQRRGKR